MTKFKLGDKVSYRNYKNALYLQETDDRISLIAVEEFGVIKGAVITVFTDEITPASDWVKCSERMPKHGEMVLVFNGNSIEIDALAIGEFAFECWCDSVTHWMPLPEIPEVKE